MASRDDLEAINRYFGTVAAKTAAAQNLKQSWAKWWKENRRSWLDYSEEEYNTARSMRNKFDLANAITTTEKAVVQQHQGAKRIIMRPTLRKGMTGKKGSDIGEAILLWRLFLGKSDLKPAAGVTSYDFGTASEKYTKEFQKSAGLAQTGVVDDKTWVAYESRIKTASPPVKAKAVAAETQGEANKAAAMAAAVAKPSTVPKPVTPEATAVVSATIPVKLKTKAKETAATVKTAATVVVDKAKTASADMPMWQRILAVGVLGIGALVGYKAMGEKRRA